MKTTTRKMDKGWEVTTYTDEFGGISELEVEVGTNGYHGGDSGHGCRTYLRIENSNCSDIEAKTTACKRGFAVILGGDSELESFIEGLEFAVKVLRGQSLGGQPFKEEKKQTKQQVAFTNYLKEVLEMYRKSRTLHGISIIRQKYHVAGLSKEQFYILGLHELANADVDVATNLAYCNAVYEYVLHHTNEPPKW